MKSLAWPEAGCCQDKKPAQDCSHKKKLRAADDRRRDPALLPAQPDREPPLKIPDRRSQPQGRQVGTQKGNHQGQEVFEASVDCPGNSQYQKDLLQFLPGLPMESPVSVLYFLCTPLSMGRIPFLMRPGKI